MSNDRAERAARIRKTVFVCLVLGAIASTPAVLAQDPNVCDEPGDFPDVIVGDLQGVNSYGSVGDIYAYSVGTTSCNIGTCWLNWFSNNNQHPVIGQNMFRLKDGRIEQIGQSWLKHGFFALSENLCSGGGCIGTSGTHLGVNCSDPYTAGLNGQQSNLGPRFEVNAATGEYPYPPSFDGQTGNAIYKRLQVHRDDLDPALNAGARYFVEGQYVTPDDAAAGNDDNNASYREITVAGGTFDISLIGETQRTKAGVQVWADIVPGVKEGIVQIDNDGRIIVSANTTDLGNGFWRYQYAVQNLNSHRSAQSFYVPVPAGSLVENLYFHDVPYHSGEPWDMTDWTGFHDTVNNRVIWQTQTYDENPNANALRWGTMYNFEFDLNHPPSFGSVFVDLFRPGGEGDPTEGSTFTWAPNPCNNDGVCQYPNETCANCGEDCENAGPPTGFCGDGICEIALGEDCLGCAADCAGQQSGNPANRFCCGAGGGQNPVECSDPRCRTGGFQCGSTGNIACCGDGACDPGEDSCICAADCGAPPLKEFMCADGIDEDCDGDADCNDLDCCTDAGCFTGVDNDNDSVADCDCDDTNPTVWSTPGEVGPLTLTQNPIVGTTINWSEPSEPGGLQLTYDTLRTQDAGDFRFTAVCLGDPNPADLQNVDGENPAAGSVYHYLVRGVNECPVGDGSLGRDSDDNERSGAGCP